MLLFISLIVNETSRDSKNIFNQGFFCTESPNISVSANGKEALINP